jgi:hypothetical protein
VSLRSVVLLAQLWSRPELPLLSSSLTRPDLPLLSYALLSRPGLPMMSSLLYRNVSSMLGWHSSVLSLWV